VATADGTTTDVVVTITGTNDAPTVDGTQSFTVIEDSSILITEAQLLAGADDADDGATLSVENLSSDNGTLTDNGDGTYTFEPAADFNGTVNLSYDVSDGTATTSATATVEVTPENDDPVITLDLSGGSSTFQEGQAPLKIAPAGKVEIEDIDSLDLDGGQLTVAMTGGTADDVLGVGPGGVHTDGNDLYYPGPNGDLIGTFEGGTNGEDLVVTFTAAATPEIAEKLLNQVTFDNDSDAPVEGGREISMTLTDGDGGTSATVSETIEVRGTPDDAVIGGTGTDELTETDVTQQAGGQLTVTDADGAAEETFTAQSDVASEYGSFNVDATGSWTFDLDAGAADGLNAGEVATQTFQVATADGTTTDVVVTITGTNDAPTVDGTQSFTMAEDGTITITEAQLLSDADDADDGATLSVENLSASNGTITDNGDGTYNFTPADNYNGTVDLNFDVSDGTDSVATTASVVVTAVNDAPVIGSAGGDTFTLAEDGTITISEADLLAGSSDVDGDTLSVTNLTIDGQAVTANADGSYTYTPPADFNGQVSLQYDVSDGTTTTAQSATSTIDVTPVNDAPVLTGGTSADTFETTVEAGETVVIGSTDLLSTDVDNTADELVYTMTAGSSHGEMQLDGVTLSVGDTFTQEDIDNGLLSYTNDGTGEGGTPGSAEFEWADGTADWVQPGEQNDYTPTPIDQDNLTSPADGTSVTVTFQGEGAGYHNSMGWYKIVDGEPSDPQIMWTDASAQGSGGSLVPGQDSVTLEGLAEGEEFGFFIVRNGANAVDGLGDGQLSFDSDGNLVSDSGSIDASQLFHTIDNDLTDGALNEDNVIHGTSGLQGDELMIGFEDLWGGGDEDYNDLMVSISYDVPAPPTDGSDSFAFTVTDGDVVVDETTFEIEITGINTAPVVDALTGGSGDEDTLISGQVEASDADGDDLTFTLDTSEGATVAANGTVTVNADGTYDYTPNADFNGSDTFTVKVDDGEGGTVTQEVTVDVAAVNDAPELTGGAEADTLEDTPVSGTLSASDVDGDDLVFSIANGPANGSVQIDSETGDFTFTPDGNWSGSDTFTFTVNDGNGGVTTGTASVSVAADADAPTVTVSNESGAEDSWQQLHLDAELTDTDGSESLSIVTIGNVPDGAILSPGSNNGDGTWEVSADQLPSVCILPPSDFVGDMEMTVSVTSTETVGGDSETTTESFTVSVTPVNDDAVIGGTGTDELTETDVTQQAAGQLTVTDADGAAEETFTAQSDVASEYGSFNVDATGSWTFDLDAGAADGLNAGEVATQTFQVATADGTTTDVVVTITGTNDAPTITGSSAGDVLEDGTLTTGGTLTATDADDGESGFVAATASGTHGDLTIDGNGVWSYTATDSADIQALDDGDTLTETFTVTTNGGDTQTITVTINGAEDAPTITGSAAGDVFEDGALTTGGTLTATDADAGESGFVAATATGAHGDLTIDGNGVWSYTATDSADIQALDDGDTLTETFTVTTNGGDTQTITVTINGAEDAPTITGSSADDVFEDGALTTGGTLTATDADAGESGFVAASASGAHGDLTIDGNGVWSYTATDSADIQALGDGDTLTEVFTVTTNGGDTEKITVTINGTNDAPTVDGTQTFTMTEDGQLQITDDQLLAGADDVDSGTVLSVENLSASNGTITANPNGGYTFTPDENFNGTVDLSYDVSDGTTSTPATAIVTIADSGDAAVIGGTASDALTETDVTQQAGGQLTVTDVDGAAEESFVAQNGVSSEYGSFNVDATGSWTFDLDAAAADGLNAGEVATQTFQVATADGTTTDVVVTITGTNDVPTVDGTQSFTMAEDGTITITEAQLLSDADDADDGATLSVENLSASNGTITDNGNGTYSFSPDAGFSGTLDLTFDVSDGTDSVATTATVVVTEAVINPTENDDDLTGTSGDDTIDALGGDDTVDGGAGDDTLTGGAGDDTLSGGDGADVLIGDGGAMTTSSTMYIMDEGSDSIISISTDGTRSEVVTQAEIIELTGDSNADFDDRGIDTDSDGNLIFTDKHSDSILMKPADGGDLVMVATSSDIKAATGESTADPKALAIGEDGMIYVSEDVSDSILRVDPSTGSVTEFISESTLKDLPGIDSVDLDGGVVAAPDGTLYVASDGSPDAIFAINTSTGDATVLASGSPFTDLDVYMTLAPNGDLIVADDSGADTIYRIETSGDGEGTVTTFLSEAEIEAVTVADVDLEGGIGFDSDGNFYIADQNDDAIYQWTGYDEETGTMDASSGSLYISKSELDEVTSGNEGPDLEGGMTFADVETQAAGDDTLSGGAGDDTLYGGGGADTLDGGADDDILMGGSGDDVLSGGTGSDTLDGGTGDDVAVFDGDVDDYTIAVNDITGEITITHKTNGNVNTVKNVETLNFGGVNLAVAAIAVAADNADNDFDSDGSSGNQDFDGSNRADTLYGGSGNDKIDGEKGHDTIYGGSGTDELKGDKGNDTLYGGSGNDKVKGEDGNDLLYGGTGDDTVDGGKGQDVLYGDAGDDTLKGGDDDDVLYGGTGNDTLEGGSGDDVLYGGAGDDTLEGGKGNDILYGGTGNDTLDGGDDDDTLYGGSGDDTLIGGEGDDDLWGGDGSDTFVFHEGDGSDTVNDFGIGDTLLFEGTWFDDGNYNVSQDGDDAIVTFGTGSDAVEVKVKDTDSNSLKLESNSEGGYSVTSKDDEDTVSFDGGSM